MIFVTNEVWVRSKMKKRNFKKKEKRPVTARLLGKEFEGETEEDCKQREAKGESHLLFNF